MLITDRNENMSTYFGVIGTSDYIKLHGDKRPFWEFLDEQRNVAEFLRVCDPSHKPMATIHDSKRRG